jgi:hypothetical protein
LERTEKVEEEEEGDAEDDHHHSLAIEYASSGNVTIGEERRP